MVSQHVFYCMSLQLCAFSRAPHFAAPRQILKNQLIHSSVLKEIKISGIKPAARLPTDDIDWNKEKLEEEKMLERDWYSEVDDVLPRIYKAAKHKDELPSGDVHAFLTLASSGKLPFLYNK